MTGIYAACICLLTARTAGAQVQASSVPAISRPTPQAQSEDSADPDEELAKDLQQAEAFYREGLRRFKAGNAEEGRAQLEKAFDIVISDLDEETLPAALHSEFAGMLEKIRNWNDSDGEADASSDLDVSDDALSAAAVSTAAVANRSKIKIDRDNPITQKFIQIYTQKRRHAVEEALGRSGRYRDMIESKIESMGLPPELFYLTMAESEYKNTAVSRSGAAGLWQFMPQTARKYGLEVSYWVDERYLPEKATAAALRYLSDLYQWFGDWDLAMAAYNRGEGGLGKDMQWSRSADFGSLAGRNALPLQTHHYVPKFMACVLIGEHPEKYGLHPKYEAPVAYDAVPLPRSLDLTVAAACAKTTEAVLRELNPELRSWATPKDRPDFLLRLPQGTKNAFLAELGKVKEWTPGPTMVRYRVRPGDFLGRIAKRHHTTIRSILQANKIRNPRLIRPGMVLLIRPGHGGRHRNID